MVKRSLSVDFGIQVIGMTENNNNNCREYAFIWDLDGTLLDSYKQILPSLMQALEDFQVYKDEKEVLDSIISTSAREFFRTAKNEIGTDWETFSQVYENYHQEKNMEVEAAPHALEILSYLQKRGIKNYVFTHRGASAYPILKNIGMDGYFEEIITAEDGFPRKPAPDGNIYLVEKYNLNKATTFYVGDRRLDMESAGNAGIGRIFYLPSYSVAKPAGVEDFVIHDFMELKNLIESGELGRGE